ncbi:MAG: hypothetical protein DWQ34_12850 [Planctomycetota bacterium]|nr:MAG: hypothetical protein DWQ34_12850 [Planctomycetota bacterium]REK24095.1 MAG: hypothetical protein DWQ41_13670 [Planctomycetota bacterium]REK38327.1 MAG: hypothetical protein DWQ45_04975 [Planctomycetota bacterium]
MSSSHESGSWLVRFCDTFFQERNIKWMLGVGMAILLGSSLMLVTTHWEEYTPLWKYAILLAYTAAIHVAGQISYHNLALRKTGTGLMALTLLLIPLSFLSVRWMDFESLSSAAGLISSGGMAALLLGNAVFASFAARRILRHFLRRTQPTFVASYVVLSLAGAVVPALPVSLAPWTGFFVWLVFAAGTMKVNRHVFWLTEERRLPRVFGFFPVALLGGLFLVLFSSSLAAHIALEWIGLGCLLVALPVLLAADALADVHEERHGSLKGPLPWSLLLPLFTALSLIATGQCLSAIGFPDAPALVPSAALAAVTFALVARRTGHRVFVWCMLGCVLLAYRTCPVFFRDLVLMMTQQAAEAVKESRLPLAFYGLTCLPLLTVTSLCARWRRRADDGLFALPLRHFSIGMTLLLLVVSLTHVKAIFPVGIALTAMFGLQAVLFRDRRLVLTGIAALATAAAGFAPFAVQVLSVADTTALRVLPWCAASALLLIPGYRIDRWAAGLDRRNAAAPGIDACQTASFAAAVLGAICWVVQSFTHVGGSLPTLSGGAVCLLLLVHALQWRKAWVGHVAVCFAVAFPAISMLDSGWSRLDVFSLTVLLLTGLWGGSLLLELRPRWLIAQAFLPSARHVPCVGLSFALASVFMPVSLAGIFSESVVAPLAAGGVLVFWAFAAAWRHRQGWLTVCGWFALLSLVGATVVDWTGPAIGRPWLPAIWAGLAAITIPTLRLGHPRIRSQKGGVFASDRRIATSLAVAISPLKWCLGATLGVVAIASLVVYSQQMIVAGGLAAAGLLGLSVALQRSALRTIALLIVSWQVVCVVMQSCIPGLTNLTHLTWSLYAAGALPVAMVASGLSWIWQRAVARNSGFGSEVEQGQSILLWWMAAVSLLATLPYQGAGLSVFQLLLAAGSFLLLALQHVDRALSRVRAVDYSGPDRASAEQHVWFAEAIVLLGVIYFARFDVIALTHAGMLYGVLFAGFVVWSVSRWASGTARTAVLARPLAMTGMALPAASVVLGFARHVTLDEPEWLGINSLALLFAAGFYFWRGLEGRRQGLLVGSAVIVNVALALLWRELDWSDPQFFMIPLGASLIGLVELLREQVPDKARDPLRYLGALVILVSPTFHIVGGSWLHLLSLMILSVATTLIAMGLRIRALMYMGTAFLLADIAAMVVRGSIDHPNVLWISGVIVGAAVIGLAAYCERHRELMLQRLRLISAELQSWN